MISIRQPYKLLLFFVIATPVYSMNNDTTTAKKILKQKALCLMKDLFNNMEAITELHSNNNTLEEKTDEFNTIIMTLSALNQRNM